MALLRERVGARARRGGDPSEATLAVLDKLTALAEPLTPEEQARVLDADTSGPLDAAALCRAWLAGAATGTSGAPRRAT
jgi:predicted kinase